MPPVAQNPIKMYYLYWVDYLKADFRGVEEIDVDFVVSVLACVGRTDVDGLIQTKKIRTTE